MAAVGGRFPYSWGLFPNSKITSLGITLFNLTLNSGQIMKHVPKIPFGESAICKLFLIAYIFIRIFYVSLSRQILIIV